MDVATLPPEVQEYIYSIEEKADKAVRAWENRYASLEEQYKLLLLQKFGRKSEKELLEERQQFLFDSEESTPPEQDTEDSTTVIKAYQRKNPGRKPIDESIPREEVIIDIPEEEKQCACGHTLTRIGEETSEKLHVIPPKMWVERIVRPKYGCKACEGSGDEENPAVRIADVRPAIIPKSIATPSLLSFIIVNKFIDHLPYYRQEKRFERIGIHISRQNMSNWQQAAFEKIEPLIERLKEHIHSGPVINMDETPVQVMGESEKKNTSKSYMWLARGGPPKKPAVLYSYRETRGSRHITDILNRFSGYLQTDGYEAYKTALAGNADIIHVGCMAHARRKFHEAAKASKKAGRAQEAINKIKKLYAIEGTLHGKELSPEQFVAERKALVEPVLEQFKEWLEKRSLQVPPSLLLGKAIRYTLNEWPKLVRYLDSPYLTPDNNIAERAIRPFVVGRKNWLFAGSPKGAESSCAMYSLIETAKQNSVNPNDYLIKVFELAPSARTTEDWKALLPWNIDP
jgi:transposase